MDKSTIWFLISILVGMVSGIATYSIFSQLNVFVLVVGGAIFGCITSMYFFAYPYSPPKFRTLLAWTLFSSSSSIVAFIAGFLVAIGALPFFGYESTMLWNGSIPDSILQGPYAVGTSIGGFVGALILALAFRYLFPRSRRNQALFLVIPGAVIPLVIFGLFWNDAEDSLQETCWLALYVTWQTVITVMLAYWFKQSKAITQDFPLGAKMSMPDSHM